MYPVSLALWAAFLIFAIFFTRRERNPRIRPLAAYLIFITVFTVVSFLLFAAIIVVVGALSQERALESPVIAVLMLLVVFVPALFVARWQIRKPPRPPVRP